MMKKSEPKISSKEKKTTKAASTAKTRTATKGTAVRGRKVTAEKTEPTDAEISRKAYELYNQRISRGEYGTPADDWHRASEILRKS